MNGYNCTRNVTTRHVSYMRVQLMLNEILMWEMCGKLISRMRISALEILTWWEIRIYGIVSDDAVEM